MKRAAILLGILAAIALYGGADVYQRARIDRGIRHHRTDFTIYQAAARALRDRTDPYQAKNPRGFRYVYPPLLAVLLMPLAYWSPPHAAMVFFALSVLALAYAFWAMCGVCRGGRAVLLAGLLCVPFFHESFERGQVTILLLALQVAALVALLRRREGSCGLALALGGALRLTPLLPAAAAGLGLLAAIRGRGLRPALRFSCGLAAGLLLGFVAVPLLALGASRAEAVTKRWIEVTEKVYAAPPGKLADLEKRYKINEYRFKNQAPRRVFATWAGWITGASFHDERPALQSSGRKIVDLCAMAVALALLFFALLLGWRRLRDPEAAGFSSAFAVCVMLPLFMTRYTWPTHEVVAFPLLALALAPRSPNRLSVWAFLVGEALFFLAHARPLETLGAAGPLLLGQALFLAAFSCSRFCRPASASPSSGAATA